MNKANIKLVDNPCNPKHLADMVNMVDAGEISGKQAKIVFEEIMQGKDPKKVVEEKDVYKRQPLRTVNRTRWRI